MMMTLFNIKTLAYLYVKFLHEKHRKDNRMSYSRIIIRVLELDAQLETPHVQKPKKKKGKKKKREGEWGKQAFLRIDLALYQSFKSFHNFSHPVPMG